MREAWGESRVPVCEALPGLNHFSVLEAMAQPGQRLNELALKLAKGVSRHAGPSMQGCHAGLDPASTVV